MHSCTFINKINRECEQGISISANWTFVALLHYIYHSTITNNFTLQIMPFCAYSIRVVIVVMNFNISNSIRCMTFVVTFVLPLRQRHRLHRPDFETYFNTYSRSALKRWKNTLSLSYFYVSAKFQANSWITISIGFRNCRINRMDVSEVHFWRSTQQ